MKAKQKPARRGAQSRPAWAQKRMPSILGLLLLGNENMRKALSGFKRSRQKGKGKAEDRSAR